MYKFTNDHLYISFPTSVLHPIILISMTKINNKINEIKFCDKTILNYFTYNKLNHHGIYLQFICNNNNVVLFYTEQT